MKGSHQPLKELTISKATQKVQILHSQSYNQLMNLRTTLLHMQYLHASLSQRLQRQHINQQNQHKDHLIQCYNLKQELQELKTQNFTKLFIVKLEELLAIEEKNNDNLLAQPQIGDKLTMKTKRYHEGTQIDSVQEKQIQMLPKVQKIITYAKIHQQQMQNSLCKLYIGNKVLLDLAKTSESIQKIQQKIDHFLTKHYQTLRLYNSKIKQFDDAQSSFRKYLVDIKPKITELVNNHTTERTQQTFNHYQEISKTAIAYQTHIKHKLIQEKKSLQQRLNQAKAKLLLYV